jgi:hypothetical protein
MMAAALAGVLTSAACSGPAPVKQTKYQVTSARRDQAMPLIVQCFADKGLLTSTDLTDSQASPAIPPSAWLNDGRVTRNTAFSNWYADKGAGLTVQGKTVDTWVNDVAYDPASWPSSACGPRPESISATPAYPLPPAE